MTDEELSGLVFKRHARVRSTDTDIRCEGVIRSVFVKVSGVLRAVVETDEGRLHIFSSKNLERVT